MLCPELLSSLILANGGRTLYLYAARCRRERYRRLGPWSSMTVEISFVLFFFARICTALSFTLSFLFHSLDVAGRSALDFVFFFSYFSVRPFGHSHPVRAGKREERGFSRPLYTFGYIWCSFGVSLD
jgi:Zn-dependent protease